MKQKIVCFLILLSFCGLCAAQQVVSSGGYALKSDVSVNWILGGSLSDIPILDVRTLNKLRIKQLMESEISIKAYPIPATDFINIEITPVDTVRLTLELYNHTGVKILTKAIACEPVNKVNISDIPSGIYYLKVFQPSSKDQLFKVEKIVKY